MFPSRWTRAALALALALAALPASAAVRIDPLLDDHGSYSVYAGQRLLGKERFVFERQGDSVLVASNVEQTLPTPRGDQPLVKKVALGIKMLDYNLLSYSSEMDFMGRKLKRGLVPWDTTFTSYHESEEGGYGDTSVRPPGRLFLIDSQVFVLFDVMLRSLNGRMFGPRTLQVVVLSEPRDSVLEVAVTPGETETIRWNGATVKAKRVTLSDGTSRFDTWVSARGRMLALEQAASGLRVERDPDSKEPLPRATGARAPAAKPAKPTTATPKPAPGGR